MLGWLFRKATAGVIESAGEAVTKVIRVTKGDKAQVEAAIADEQLATLASAAAEFAERGTRTKLDSVVDFINRLPRPLIVFWALSFLIIPYFAPAAFIEYVFSLRMIPEEIWTLILAVFSFFLGSRIISHDIRKPKLTEEEKSAAIEIIRERERVVLENRTPLVVEVPPTRKPHAPAWAEEILARPKIPVIKPEPGKPIEIIKGRPAEVDKMIAALIAKEGGYVNDSADSGGATKYGITNATLNAWRERECSIDEVKALTKEEAAEIFRAEYYFRPSIDSLPTALQAHVLDISANCGPRTAVRLLQQALNELGSEVKCDGVIGPVTRDACNTCDLKALNNKLVDIRIKFYEQLAAKRPKDRKFLAGWKKRAKSFLV